MPNDPTQMSKLSPGYLAVLYTLALSVSYRMFSTLSHCQRAFERFTGQI